MRCARGGGVWHKKLKEKASRVKAMCVAPGLAATERHVRKARGQGCMCGWRAGCMCLGR